MRTHKNKKWISAMAMIIGVASILAIGISKDKAEGISPICAQSEECRAAAEQEEEANQKKAESESTANEYQNKVNELSAAVSDQESKIQRSEDRIGELKDQIEKNKDNLKKKQKALAEMLVNKHFEDDKEPIKILAGSNSISDLAEKASRDETAKQQVGSAAEAVRETKMNLEKDKQEVEQLLAEQQDAKKELVAKRKEQQDFVNKYKDDAEGYAEVAAAAREAQMKAIQEYQMAHQSSYSGLGAFAGAYNSYDWQNDCPYGAGYDDIGYPKCQCTSYAAFKAREYTGDWGLNIAYMGDARFWVGSARARGFQVDNNPAPHSVGISVDGPYGHVFWIEDVSGGEVYITEYNNYYATALYYQTEGHPEDFGARRISLQEAYQYNYIHFD